MPLRVETAVPKEDKRIKAKPDEIDASRVSPVRLYIFTGSPWENGYVESFNGTMVNELLYREVFDTLNEAKVLLGRWMREYNTKCQWQFKNVGLWQLNFVGFGRGECRTEKRVTERSAQRAYLRCAVFAPCIPCVP